MSVIIPRTLVDNWGDHPLFFFAGPVRGGGDWQYEAYQLLMSQTEGQACAVIPVRYRDFPSHPIHKDVLYGRDDVFPHQTAMERHYLRLAGTPSLGKRGCILFWLGLESSESPHPGPDPYAMNTRGELGEWRGRMMDDPDLRVVIGAHPDFPGLRHLKRNQDEALGYRFPIYPTLEQTVAAAIRMAQD